MDEVEFHAPPRESKSKRWLSFHPFSGLVYILYEIQSISFNIISNHLISTNCDKRMNRLTAKPLFLILLQSQSFAVRTKYSIL